MNLNFKTIALGCLIFPLSTLCLAQQWQYVVKKGDNLWSIAQEYLISETYTKKLQQFNSVKDPYKLQPGTTISAPVEWLGNLPGSASVISITGDVQVEKNEQISEISEGYAIQANDKIITGVDGVAVLEFSDKSTVRIYANTILSFNKFKQSFDGSIVKARISIKSGRIKVHTNPAKKQGHRLEIESPAAVTAVRGTEFRVGVDDVSSDTVAEVLTGQVLVSAQGDQVAVAKLYGTKTQTGKKPIDPVKLLNAPDLIVKEIIESKIGTIAWNNNDKAVTYRVRVANDESMADIVYDQVVFSNQVNNIYFPRDGEFYTTVRAVDANDIEGVDAVAKLSVNARPDPPLIIKPKHNTTTFDKNPDFLWAIPSDSTIQLHYQLSANENFDPLLFDQVVDSTDRIALQKSLDVGDYYWRVANIDKDGIGPYSKISLLSIKKEPELVPEIDDSESRSKVQLSLKHDPEIDRYHAQIARDKNFNNLVSEQWVDGDEFSFYTEGAGGYYIRLGIEDKEANEVYYGESQKVIVPYEGIKQLLISLATGLLILL